jgi:hypothetical protein
MAAESATESLGVVHSLASWPPRPQPLSHDGRGEKRFVRDGGVSGGSFLRRRLSRVWGEVEAVEVHHLIPHRHEVADEGRLRVAAAVEF